MPAQLRHVAACALPPVCGWRRFGCRTSLDGCIPGTPGTPSHRRDIPPSGWISSFPVWDVGSSIGTGTVRNRTSLVCPASAVQPAFHSLGKIRSPQPRGIPALLSGPTALPPSTVHSRLNNQLVFHGFFHGFTAFQRCYDGASAAIYRRKQGFFDKKHPKKHKKRRSFSPRFRHLSEVLLSSFCAGLPMGSSTQRDAHTGVLHRFSCSFPMFFRLFCLKSVFSAAYCTRFYRLRSGFSRHFQNAPKINPGSPIPPASNFAEISVKGAAGLLGGDLKRIQTAPRDRGFSDVRTALPGGVCVSCIFRQQFRFR